MNTGTRRQGNLGIDVVEMIKTLPYLLQMAIIMKTVKILKP